MNKDQSEEDAIQRFIEYLKSKNNQSYGITGRNVPVTSGENFDYELTDASGNKLAVELFRLIDSEEEIKRNKGWSTVVHKLSEELTKRDVKGYFIHSPASFTFKKKELQAFINKKADEIEMAIKNRPNDERFENGDFEYAKIDQMRTVVFSYGGVGGSIDPRGTAFASFSRLLPKKNKQLSVKCTQRILLVANWAMFVDRDDAIKALTNIDFGKYQNIDLIVYEIRSGQFEVIFEKAVMEALSNLSLLNNLESQKLLNQNLRYLLSDKNQGAFEYVKRTVAEKRNLDWLDDAQTRENLVQYADDRVINQSIDEALWVLEHLQDDPNPSENGENDPDDPEGKHNYHSQILKGEDTHIITTVRGHLCWLMCKLIARNDPKLYPEIIKILTKYARGGNLYIRSMVSYPLTDLVRRIGAHKNQDGSSFDWDDDGRQSVRNLSFEMLRENQKYPRVMQSLVHVLDYLRHVNESEAEEILNAFLATGKDYVLHDVSALVVYYALFRHNDWSEDSKFNPAKFIKILKTQIVKGDHPIRESLVWHFWKILGDVLPYDQIKDYLPLFWQAPYDPGVASKFGLLFEKLQTYAPDDAIELYQMMLNSLQKEAKNNPTIISQLWINGTEEVLPLITNPDTLIQVVKALQDIWVSGRIYIGDIKTIFETYKQMSPENKARVKNAFLIIYKEMKNVQPGLAEVSWEL